MHHAKLVVPEHCRVAIHACVRMSNIYVHQDYSSHRRSMTNDSNIGLIFNEGIQKSRVPAHSRVAIHACVRIPNSYP